MAIKTVEYALPDYLACALMYGDHSDLDDSEEEELSTYLNDKLAKHGGLFWCLGVEDSCGVCWNHDYNTLGVDCSIFIFQVNEV